MVKLKFEIDDNILIPYIIARAHKDGIIGYAREKYTKDFVTFHNKAYKKSEKLYETLRGRIFNALSYSEISDYKELGKKLDAFIIDVSQLDEYRKLKTQTIQSSEPIKKEWDKNYEKTYEYLLNIGIKISGEFTIILVHPALPAGHYYGNNRICWSNQTYWPNYNTVYIWHEILHSFFESGKHTHALVELITDDHMRSILNGDKYPPFFGHDFLKDFKENALPIWQKYLYSKDKNIKNLVKEFKVAYANFSQ